MPSKTTYRFVIDTNVVFEGLTKKGSASAYLIDAWYAELFDAYVSTTMAYEYIDVLARKLSPDNWNRLQPAVGKLLSTANLVTIYYSWRPISPDFGDDHVIDCAMNASASVVTWNLRDFRAAEESLGLSLLSPVEAVLLLTEG